jgi:hypothetical protein
MMNKLYIVKQPGNYQYYNGDTDPNFNDGVWRFMVAVYDRYAEDGNRVKLFIDANLIAAGACSDADMNQADYYLTGNMTTTNTCLDDIFLYNRALTEAEIFLLYNNGSGYDPTPNPNEEESGGFSRRMRRLEKGFQ